MAQFVITYLSACLGLRGLTRSIKAPGTGLKDWIVDLLSPDLVGCSVCALTPQTGIPAWATVAPDLGRKFRVITMAICFVSGAAGVLVGHPFDTVKVG